jgi:hypothetical protein
VQALGQPSTALMVGYEFDAGLLLAYSPIM